MAGGTCVVAAGGGFAGSVSAGGVAATKAIKS
jgi:hypothetical protein